jgi:hypothetical protein
MGQGGFQLLLSFEPHERFEMFGHHWWKAQFWQMWYQMLFKRLGLEMNTKVEEVLLGSLFGEETNSTIGFYCNLNRTGRRFVQSKDTAPVGLWLLILSRIQHMDLPYTCDPWAVHQQGMEDNALNANSKEGNDEHQNVMIRRASVLFLLWNGAVLEM